MTLRDLPAAFTPMQALAWIALRDAAPVILAGDLDAETEGHLAEVQLPAIDDGPTGPAIRREMVRIPGRGGLTLLKLEILLAMQPEPERRVASVDRAQAELLAALRAGRLTAAAIREDGTKQTIPAEQWVALRFAPSGDDDRVLLICRPERSFEPLPAAWAHARLPRAQLLRLWPPAGAVPPELLQEAPGHAEEMAPAAAEPADAPPQYSLAALRGWYRLRVGEWPPEEPPPSESQDWKAANARYGRAIPRDLIRRIRRELAPDTWKKPGPRRSSRPA